MEGNDTAQICLNGHLITGYASTKPNDLKTFCPKCGEKTIKTCPSCNGYIHGYHRGIYHYKTPAYCHNCGKPYPWTENKIQTAIQMFAEFGNLEETEKATIEEDIKNIARYIPQGELSAMRIKRIWDKYGKIAYNVIMEFASKTAAEILKNS